MTAQSDYTNKIMIKCNDELLSIDNNTSLHKVLLSWGYELNSIAVAINSIIIPKQQYENTLLQQGDNIDILTAMQGG